VHRLRRGRSVLLDVTDGLTLSPRRQQSAAEAVEHVVHVLGVSPDDATRLLEADAWSVRVVLARAMDRRACGLPLLPPPPKVST
jgi:hypothetical protein